MKIIFLGTNGWYDSPMGNTICVLIETQKEYLILDAGNGFHKLDRYLVKPKPVYLFLSHFHLDHVCGLHVLNKLALPQGIDVFGPRGLKKWISVLINQPFSASLTQLKTPVRLLELKDSSSLPFSFVFKKLKHTTPCLGYRFVLENKVITYCTDTGLCDNLNLLSHKADLLITECSYLPGQRFEPWPHLNPEDAAGLAYRSQAKRLVLTHFDASLYLSFKDRRKAQRVARTIFENAVAVRDDQEIDL